MHTCGEVLKLASEFLLKKGVLAPRLSSEELLSSILGCSRTDLYMRFDIPLHEAELTKFREWLLKRSTGMPVEYITGFTNFYGACLKIDKRALIPRPETEILADILYKACQHETEKTLMDMGCGSGCLAISLKKKLPSFNVIGVDLSKEALELTEENAKDNEVLLTLYQSNFFENLPDLKLDYFICNPPYIAQGAFESLSKEVSGFEPFSALVGGEDGLECYRKLEERLPAFLNPGAKLFFEIGFDQKEGVLSIFNKSYWKRNRVEKDWSGQNRFFFLELE